MERRYELTKMERLKSSIVVGLVFSVRVVKFFNSPSTSMVIALSVGYFIHQLDAAWLNMITKVPTR